MKAVLKPSGITVQALLVEARNPRSRSSRFWDIPLNGHNIKQFQLLRLVLPLRFRQ